MKDAV